MCARLFQFMLRIHVHSNQYTFPHMQLSTISVRLLQNLEIFRKEHIQKTKVCAPRVCNVFKCICYTNAFVKLTPSLAVTCIYCTCIILLHTHIHTHSLSLPRQEEKKQFDRSSERYYQSLEKKLSVSNKKKESALNEVSMYITLYIHVCLFVYICVLTCLCVVLFRMWVRVSFSSF